MWLSKYRTKSSDRLHKYTSLKHGVDRMSGCPGAGAGPGPGPGPGAGPGLESQ